MAALKVRRDDNVRIIAGKDKGKTGHVLRADPRKQKVCVEGANIIKRHAKPRTLRDIQRAQELGGIVEMEGPIHVSNVMLVDPESGEPTPRERQARRAAGACAWPRSPARTSTDGSARHRPRSRRGSRSATRRRSARGLQERFGYSSAMEVPRVEKITLNMGVGEAKQDSNMLDAAKEQLATIAGQQPERAPGAQVDRAVQAARGHAGRRRA